MESAGEVTKKKYQIPLAPPPPPPRPAYLFNIELVAYASLYVKGTYLYQLREPLTGDLYEQGRLFSEGDFME